MFRLCGRLWRKNHLIGDMDVCDERPDLCRTKKVYDALDKICCEFDLCRPIWLDSNVKEFLSYDKTRFGKDSFVEEIAFDYLEIHVMEED